VSHYTEEKLRPTANDWNNSVCF